MTRYSLDTNHLSAYLDRDESIQKRVDAALKAGDRVGICFPVLCEFRAGIRLSRRYKQNLARLRAALAVLRIWPMDEETAAEFAELFCELRAAGRMLSQFDLLIAASARRHGLTLLTADRDFDSVRELKIENWR